MLSIFLTESHIILAHEEIATRTHEIPILQQLLTESGLSGYVFTADALHCQEKTLQIARESHNAVMVQVKDNQPTLLKDCQCISKETIPDTSYQEPCSRIRNRIEQRRVDVFHFPKLTHPHKWQAVQAVIKVERCRRVFDPKTKSWKDSDETCFYSATLVLDAQDYAHAIRKQWGIENRNHYVRDVTLGEDKSRIRTNPHTMAKLRSFALNILRKNTVDNGSQELFNNCMNIDNVLKYVGVL